MAIVVVQPAQHGDRDDCLLAQAANLQSHSLGNRLIDSLMGSRSIEVPHIVCQHTTKMTLMQDQEMVETLSADTAQEALADGIGPGSSVGSSEHLDAAGGRDTCKLIPVLAIVVTDQIPGSCSERRRLSQLLRDLLISRMPRDSHMDHYAGTELNDKEGKQGPKPEISNLKEVAGVRSRAHGYGGR